MKTINVDIENCYGIRKLRYSFDFSRTTAYAVYAPNGAMKSSLAQTFRDLAEGNPSKDRVFPARESARAITDENGNELPPDSVLVVRNYDEQYQTEKTSTLLVDSALRKEYEQLHLSIDESKERFLKAIRQQSGSKKDLEKEIAAAFTKSDTQFYRALIRIREELLAQRDAQFADIEYDRIFDDRVIDFLGTKDFKTAIEAYIRHYNALLAASTYFKKGIFNYYNAATIAKSLAANGFFDARHTVNLNAAERLEITSQAQLEEVIAKEKEGISKDKELRKKFADIEKLLMKNVSLRDFQAYLQEHEELLPKLENVDGFREELFKSYFKKQIDLYEDLIGKYKGAEQRKRKIEEKAASQRTLWESVIAIFNERFFVPFRLSAKNRVSVILGQEPMLVLGFTFEEGTEKAPVEKDQLLEVLSQGEKKALYILNVIFEIEVRKKANQETVLLLDDIADSFDYKNKYAIIQYLTDIASEGMFKQIILTHNFDFFRTVNSRFVAYDRCLTATKGSAGVTLGQASGIRNVFVNDWKGHFFTDPKKRVASIPFIRNLVEYTRGEQDATFERLTSLLHWKSDSAAVTHAELDRMYNEVFCASGSWQNESGSVTDCIFKEADACLGAPEGVNFENKIVLSIATRLAAERFMAARLGDTLDLSAIRANQTARLLEQFKSSRGVKESELEVMQRVALMTPQNIHLNAFMYEPILDMSDDHLRKLYRDVVELSRGAG